MGLRGGEKELVPADALQKKPVVNSVRIQIITKFVPDLLLQQVESLAVPEDAIVKSRAVPIVKRVLKNADTVDLPEM